ncbi:hypothetical protein MBEHAL_2643 [Halarchaeum acidiphilum MH1-52-1]|uniref:Uncharacterized protein n=2 Tax=Halarchaeum acidiphilum TaxID=489138 RepID=U3AGG9_9EURY|nr:hypothetical protein MBEHAL_2643 [Halarchaeum acidiphilum MH1-52-1]
MDRRGRIGGRLGRCAGFSSSARRSPLSQGIPDEDETPERITRAARDALARLAESRLW